MKEKQTPLMKQYNKIKDKYPDTILLFRLGDFYETFADDAILTAKACGITLTKRNNGAVGDIPLAGFPYHQLDAYMPKLVQAGYRVAVCEQLEDPKRAKGIVKRGVVEVVTPGVTLYDKILDTKKNNYIASLCYQEQKNGIKICGLAICDVSTAEFFTTEFDSRKLVEVLESISPSEIIISKPQQYVIKEMLEELSYDPAMTKLEDWIFDPEFTRDQLINHFATTNLKGFGIEGLQQGKIAAGVIIHYINETQSKKLEHIRKISYYDPFEFMQLDYSTRRNLEITYTLSGGSKEGTLISLMDRTVTAMGGRLFRKWINRPLKSIDKIHFRLEAVRSFNQFFQERALIRKYLNEINDIERITTKICTGRANPRDLAALRQSLKTLPEIKLTISEIRSGSLDSIIKKVDLMLDLVELLDNAIVEEPGASIGSGNVFKEGYSKELDTYIEAKFSGKNWISKYQEEERHKTDIPSLKVGYNSVFGYYIEVTKVHSSKVPDRYDRKQTLTSAERYTTPDLNEIEQKILTAEEKINELELKLFNELRQKIALDTEKLQNIAHQIAVIDCLQGFAQVAQEKGFVEPEIDDSEIIDIVNGKHPVVEQLLPLGEIFTPNSTYLDTDDKQIHIITGPNMSGKSCYLRQVALIVLLGQVGSFVPAKSARFGTVDRIFTRVGAQDNISAGESTFLVEMQEAANILNNATKQSLILLDEVGRGTATFDGISIAWSIAEYLHNFLGAKTLFATHYHELNGLEERYPRIINYKVEVIETDGSIVFSHKLRQGTSDHSFGIHVAKMAGLPYDVVQRADEIMHSLEENAQTSDTPVVSSKPDLGAIQTKKGRYETDQLAIFEFRDDYVRKRLRDLNIDNLTPMQALQILADLHRESLNED